MLWTEWYLLLVLFPSAVLFLFVKDRVRLAQPTLKHSMKRKGITTAGH